jgi:AcrR family transcriptional regulator
VAPPVIYARVDTKDDLFLAVYDHGVSRLDPASSPLTDDERYAELSPREVVVASVRAVTDGFHTYDRFLRAVILVSSSHREIRSRGMVTVRALRDQFVRRVRTVLEPAIPLDRIEGAFDVVFAVAVFLTAYGSGFLGSTDDVDQVAEMVVARLLPSGHD